MLELPAITLWQPWATLLAIGMKTVETRSWCAADKYIGRPIAIHAAKKPIGACLPNDDPQRRAALMRPWLDNPKLPMPYGAVVAIARLNRCTQVNTVCADGWARCNDNAYKVDPYGDYSPGRYLWILDGVMALPKPIPARGSQGIWTWKHQGEIGVKFEAA